MKVTLTEANGGSGGRLFATFLAAGMVAILIPWVIANTGD